jgi:hypothetical protein
LLFDDGLGVDACGVDCGALELEKATLLVLVAVLVEVVAMLEVVGTADVVPMSAVSTKILEFNISACERTTRLDCECARGFHKAIDLESGR